MVFEKIKLKKNYNFFCFLYYHLNFLIILVCIGISLESLNSPRSQLSFDVL